MVPNPHVGKTTRGLLLGEVTAAHEVANASAALADAATEKPQCVVHNLDQFGRERVKRQPVDSNHVQRAAGLAVVTGSADAAAACRMRRPTAQRRPGAGNEPSDATVGLSPAVTSSVAAVWVEIPRLATSSGRGGFVQSHQLSTALMLRSPTDGHPDARPPSAPPETSGLTFLGMSSSFLTQKRRHQTMTLSTTTSQARSPITAETCHRVMNPTRRISSVDFGSRAERPTPSFLVAATGGRLAREL